MTFGSNPIAHYGPLLSMGWVGDRPAEYAPQLGRPVPKDWRDVVVDKTLACGIRVVMERRGLVAFYFEAWPVGMPKLNMPPSGNPAIRTVGEVSEAFKPALIARLRVMNTHLTLLQGASMHLRSESPRVSRLRPDDLYSFEDADEEWEEGWYRPLGRRLPDEVTVIERARLHAETPEDVVGLSLDWLDLVLARGKLVEFDLLNQAQVAVRSHDYPLALVAGWTVCEIQMRAIADAHPRVNLRPRADAVEVTAALHSVGKINASRRSRLDAVRQQRNAWIHNAHLPGEETALEATRLAAELLAEVLPQFRIRATKAIEMP